MYIQYLLESSDGKLPSFQSSRCKGVYAKIRWSRKDSDIRFTEGLALNSVRTAQVYVYLTRTSLTMTKTSIFLFIFLVHMLQNLLSFFL